MKKKESAEDFFEGCIRRADASWHEVLRSALSAVERQTPGYLLQLSESYFLPVEDQLFAAFSQPLNRVSYVLIGEGPYPRAESANGYCFMDGAVKSLWALEEGGGLSKQVNRATSLRNFMKMLLVAERHIDLCHLRLETIAEFAAKAKLQPNLYIQSLMQLQANFLNRGFLLLNASLVFREEVSPVIDAKAWLPFLDVVLKAITSREPNVSRVTVILWGKIADRLKTIEYLQDSERLSIAKAEHPYNLSFISNRQMHALFSPLNLLRAT